VHRLVLAFFLLTGSCLSAPLLAAATPSAAQVQKQAVRAVEVMVQTQKETDAWALEEARLLDQAEQLQDELERVGRQRRKTEAYAADQQQKIDELTRRLAEAAKLRHDLEPLLDRTLARLTRDGQAWPDFLTRPRTDRLAQVAASLNDYDLALAQKAKLVLDTQAHGARSGQAVEVTAQELAVAGRRVPGAGVGGG
jgi:septal ring factor EnvC (AmiA/AmiB activator)